jgi:hypothetical protein
VQSSEVKLKEENIYGWNGYRLKAGDISLGITPQIGGRIISLTYFDEELLFVQEEHKGEVFDFSYVGDLAQEKERLGFRVWGGDKTWAAPQNAWWSKIPPLELDAGQYSVHVINNGLEMVSPVCRETGLQIIRRIELKVDQSIVLTETFRNTTNQEIQRGIWNVTQVLRPFNVYLPAKKENVRAYEDEGLIEEALKKISVEGDWVRVQCNDQTQFKFGGIVDQGLIMALRKKDENETLAFMREFSIDPQAAYAHDAIVEVYNSPTYEYLEIEVHAPLIKLQKGQETIHRQTWKIVQYKGEASPSFAVDYFSKM